MNTLTLNDWQITVSSSGAPALAARLNAVLGDRSSSAVPLVTALARSGFDLVEDPRAGLVHGDLDELDVVYRTTLPHVGDDTKAVLSFSSIAAIATITCNGREVAWSQNQYLPCLVDLTGQLSNGAELVVTCHALGPWLDAERRPRPRWKTKLVVDQRLRHVRLGLLGRIPSWTPPVPVIGLAGPVTLTSRETNDVRVELRTSLVDDLTTGTLDVRVIPESARTTVIAVTARCHRTTGALHRELDGGWRGAFDVGHVDPWWPHTHGTPTIYPVEITITTIDGTQTTEIIRTGFRHVALDRGPDGEGFALVLNGERVFWRGSAWMPIDVGNPWVDRAQLRDELVRCRDAGMNMIRLTGITGWEQPAFTTLCDELGIAVWQDLPFATLDQPTDEAFVDEVHAEIRHHVRRLASSPCVVVLCGGSERQQQAAMLGLDRETVGDAVAARLLHEVATEQSATAIVVGCSPSGGHLPFAADSGVSHYYGVGAYLRPLTDARHANVRFTTECLAFANVPEPATIHRLLAEGESAPTHPRWKRRVARDRGVGWDFEDVRDHYFAMVIGEDPAAMRWRDVERYLELSRVVTAIVMSTTMAEWRRPASTCGGAVTWFLRDLWRGAGWGLLDSDGRAKAAWTALAEAWAPVAIALVDEGVNGVDVWIHNDRPTPWNGIVELSRVLASRVVGQAHQRPVHVDPRSSLRLRADDLVGRFTDPNGAYLFGPSAHDALCARLITSDGSTTSRAVLDTSRGRSLHHCDLELSGSATWLDATMLALDLTTTGLARFVRVEDESLSVASHHVDVVPGETRRLTAHVAPGRPVPSSVHIGAVNARSTTRLAVPPQPPQPQRSERTP